MKHSVGAFLWLLSLTFAAGHRAETYPVTSRYDHASDTTTIRLALLSDEGSPMSLTLHAHAAFRGREPNESGRFWFQLAITQGQATRKSPAQFAVNEPVLLWLDGAPRKVPLTDYQREYYELVRRVSEAVNVPVERDDLSLLLAAHELSGQNGNVKFQLPAAALNALKAFITRQVLAGQ